MNMIYIFGYDDYHPSGGLNDVVAILDNSAGDKVDQDGWLLPGVLIDTLAKLPETADTLEVLHLHANGAPKLIENWVRVKSEKLPDAANSALSDVRIENSDGYEYRRYKQGFTLAAPVF